MPDDVWSSAVDDLPLDRSNRMMRRGETEITLADRRVISGEERTRS
ncbi:hypothetical protein KH017_16370 [bacterium]|nr:hypothetical protein [bacterium]